MRTNNIILTKHFKLYEFECPCCKTVRIKALLLERLEFLRGVWDRPIVITSGYRCEAHNAAVNGVPRSRHRTGSAVDIKMPAVLQDEFCVLAIKCGFTKAIAYGTRNFIHLEV